MVAFAGGAGMPQTATLEQYAGQVGRLLRLQLHRSRPHGATPCDEPMQPRPSRLFAAAESTEHTHIDSGSHWPLFKQSERALHMS